jgi:hypothetical protein
MNLLLDNLCAHISKETTAWLAARSEGLLAICAPEHASWINLMEGLPKMARFVSPLISAASKAKFNVFLPISMTSRPSPVLHTWICKVVGAA